MQSWLDYYECKQKGNEMNPKKARESGVTTNIFRIEGKGVVTDDPQRKVWC